MNPNGKAPLILNPYGGPGAQTVRDFWVGYDLFDQILARQGFAVLHVDNRGMANRGKAFALPIKHHLGPVELSDQLAAMKEALDQFPQLDRTRVGFWGWSYGGYFTLYALEHSDQFKGGVVGRAGDRLAQLRFHLYRALHGPAEGERSGIQGQLARQLCRRPAWPAAGGTRHQRRQRARPEHDSDGQQSDRCGQAIPA